MPNAPSSNLVSCGAVHHSKRLALLICAIVSGLSGCSGDENERQTPNSKPSEHVVDEESWRDAAEEHYPLMRDWETYRDNVLETCAEEQDPDEWAIDISLGLEYGISVEDQEFNITHACPDQLDTFKQGLEAFRETTERVDWLCAADPESLTADERDEQDAVCS